MHRPVVVRPAKDSDFQSWMPPWDGHNAAGRRRYDKFADHGGFIIYAHDA